MSVPSFSPLPALATTRDRRVIGPDAPGALMAEGAVTTPRAVRAAIGARARIAVIHAIVLIFETCVCRARVSAGVRWRGRGGARLVFEPRGC